MDENRALFRALSLEKLVTAIFIGLITFVAGLNILVVLSMTVTDKARDIAVLMAMGARREQVRNIFMWQGLVVGTFGTAGWIDSGFCNCLGSEYLEIDSVESGSLRDSLCAVSFEWIRRIVDCGRVVGDQHSGDADPCPRSRPDFARRDSSLRVVPAEHRLILVIFPSLQGVAVSPMKGLALWCRKSLSTRRDPPKRRRVTIVFTLIRGV